MIKGDRARMGGMDGQQRRRIVTLRNLQKNFQGDQACSRLGVLCFRLHPYLLRAAGALVLIYWGRCLRTDSSNESEAKSYLQDGRIEYDKKVQLVTCARSSSSMAFTT